MDGRFEPIVSNVRTPRGQSGIASAQFGEMLLNDWNVYSKASQSGDGTYLTTDSYLVYYTVGNICFVRYRLTSAQTHGWTTIWSGLPCPPTQIYEYHNSINSDTNSARVYFRITTSGEAQSYCQDASGKSTWGSIAYPIASWGSAKNIASPQYNAMHRFGNQGTSSFTNPSTAKHLASGTTVVSAEDAVFSEELYTQTVAEIEQSTEHSNYDIFMIKPTRVGSGLYTFEVIKFQTEGTAKTIYTYDEPLAIDVSTNYSPSPTIIPLITYVLHDVMGDETCYVVAPYIMERANQSGFDPVYYLFTTTCQIDEGARIVTDLVPMSGQ